MYDLIILGGSAAGVTAAVYAARRKLNMLLITSNFGGEIITTAEIENWPGENKISGFDFARKLEDQIKYNQIPFVMDQSASRIEKENASFLLKTRDSSNNEHAFETKTVIIATGAQPKELGVAGEKEFFHKGVTYCATCDAPLFKNKTVAVVGGGNSALTSALMLGDLAAQVYLLNCHPDFQGEVVLIEKVKSHSKIKILNEVSIQQINGDKMVKSLEYADKDNCRHTLEVQGIFVHIGLRPNAEFVDLAKKNKRGEIITDRLGQTSLPGLFAAGDVTDAPYKQMVTAAGMGCAAALSAIDYLDNLRQ